MAATSKRQSLPPLDAVLQRTARKAQYTFRYLPRHDSEDQIQQANMYAIEHYRSCQRRGKTFSANLIATYAVKRAAARAGNAKDILSWRTDRRRGQTVVRVGYGFNASYEVPDSHTFLAAISEPDEDPGYRMDRLQFLDSLPPRTREIIELFFAGYSSAEIGWILEMTARNVNYIRASAGAIAEKGR